MKKYLFLLLIANFLFSISSYAKTYNLEIKKQKVFITNKAIEAITINNTIPGPTLYFSEGEDVVINVKNLMDEKTSIHWHGILLPGNMDGVPGLNGFEGIEPNTTYTYKFKIKQTGTYWYHSHSNLQEQQGAYGSIVIKNKEDNDLENDYVILLSDFTEENPKTILNNLKIDSGYYNYNKRTVFTFFSDVNKKGFINSIKNYWHWGKMRMDPTDLSDVTNYHFLINGKTNKQNWTKIFNKEKPVKLRFINASAMTIYDISIPGLKMKFIEADGQKIKPVIADEFRIGVAETYDVIVVPLKDRAYTIFAESIDRTGYARATIAPKRGMSAEIPKMRSRTILTMNDMIMEDIDHTNMDHTNMDHTNMDHTNMDHGTKIRTKETQHIKDLGKQFKKNDKIIFNDMDHFDHSYHKIDKYDIKNGWANRSTPIGNIALEYSDLISLHKQKDLRKPIREIEFEFGGNMNRYIWTINNKKFPEPTILKFGEKVRLKFINKTMMAHPIHLHGMFMQLENGQSEEWMPNKHTVIVPPAQTVSLLLTADESGQWAFHCHLLLHMANGMMTSLSVEKPYQIKDENNK